MIGVLPIQLFSHKANSVMNFNLLSREHPLCNPKYMLEKQTRVPTNNPTTVARSVNWGTFALCASNSWVSTLRLSPLDGCKGVLSSSRRLRGILVDDEYRTGYMSQGYQVGSPLKTIPSLAKKNAMSRPWVVTSGVSMYFVSVSHKIRFSIPG